MTTRNWWLCMPPRGAQRGILVVVLLLSLGLGCCKKQDTDSAPSTSASSTTPLVSSPPTPSAVPKKSAWLDKNGGQKIKFGFDIPGGGKVTTKPGGFQTSAGFTVTGVYQKADVNDLIAAFEILATRHGVEMIDDPTPLSNAKAYKLIHDGKPYKAHVLKRAINDECVVSVSSP